MKAILKNTLALFSITLVAGLLLGLVYEVTKEPIKEQRQKTKEKAFQAVFEEADHFEASPNVNLDGLQMMLSDQGYQVTLQEVSCAVKDTAMMGYVVVLTSHEGYGGDIKLAMGIRMDGTVSGISILSIAETPGLGMKAKEESFRNQFLNKQVDHFTYTKAQASTDSEIDAITSATITTNAMTNAVNAGISVFNSLGGGLVE